MNKKNMEMKIFLIIGIILLLSASIGCSGKREQAETDKSAPQTNSTAGSEEITIMEENGYTVYLEQAGEFQISGDYEYQEGEDWDWSQWNVHNASAFAKGENGYYVRMGEYVYFCSFEHEVMTPLCNRPECLHDKETDKAKKEECIAYVPLGSIGEGLQYCDGKLYANTNTLSVDPTLLKEGFAGDFLVELAADGSSRTVLDYKLENAYTFAIHRGSIYYTAMETDPETLESTQTVYRLDPEKKKQTRIAWLEGEMLFRVHPYGEYVYINILLAQDNEVPWLIYDIASGKVMAKRNSWHQRIVPDSDNEFLLYSSVGDNTQKVEIMKPDGSEREVIGELSLSGLEEFGFGEVRSAFLYESWISEDDAYFYAFGMVNGSAVTAIFDRNTCELLQVLLMDGMPPYQCIGTDDTYIFYMCDESYSMVNRVYWIKKEDMLKRDAAFCMIEP